MTNPKKNRKVFNIILAIVLAVGVWLYVINVENPPVPSPSGTSPSPSLGRIPWPSGALWSQTRAGTA